MTWGPVPILDFADQGIPLLLDQFGGKPAFESWIRSYLNQIQKAEDCLWEVINIRGIDLSFGTGLDYIGNLVGRHRLGLADVDYRIALRVEILINRSSGTADELITIASLCYSTLTTNGDLISGEAFPATIWMQIPFGISDTVISVIYDSLIRSKVGGVRLLLQTPGAVVNNTFTFSPYAREIPSTTRGFADYFNPGTGGHLAGIKSS